ncbi:cysteine desulfurase family protein [Aestuariibius sp. HNIBRBA575]|uniref:cysteine desulfurase family protein n=1 Tax=Aestuariibius sp. HNIBRBA575 TaxID=3233343 RepID=UPI0034A1558F
MIRTYLDHNATAPLRSCARDAMIAAMGVIGNPSSVHGEGRAAKGIIEKARQQVAAAVGCHADEVIFTSGASEAAALALAGRDLSCAGVEHDCVQVWADPTLPVDANGRIEITDPSLSAVQLANSETGILQELPQGLALVDAVQAVGRVPWSFAWSGAQMALLSAHKFGGPKGVGALIVKRGLDVAAQLRGGGQEMGRRAGTENVIGIAGMGAAAQAAAQDQSDGTWDRIATLRDFMEEAIAAASKETIFVGKGAARLPNTSNFITPNWKGETQVMNMDLAGFSVSAGSACSSGKVKASKVLLAMGFDEMQASSAIRVSLGPQTTKDEVEQFATAWERTYKRHAQRAA